mgnify:CR=1 FL=1
MNFIANYWFVWLIVAVLCTAYSFHNQIHRAKRMISGQPSSPFVTNDPFNNDFFAGLGLLVTVELAATIFWIFFVVGVIVKIVEHLKQ